VGSTPTWSTRNALVHGVGNGQINRESVSDGPDMVSTGVDSRDGNTVGDDRKSSKKSNRK